jgi:hypothetical protein
MVSAFAGDFINMGDDTPRRQIHLNLACTAWNLANLPKSQRKKTFRKYMDDFRGLNPEANIAAIEYNLKQLIAAKLAQFPREMATIISAEYIEGENEDRLSIASVPAGTPPPPGGVFRWN